MARDDLWAQAAKEVASEQGQLSDDSWTRAAQEVGQEAGQSTDYASRREQYRHLMKTDPGFRAKPPEERAKVLFSEEESRERPVTLKPWRGPLTATQEEFEAGQRTFREGLEEFRQPRSYLRSLAGIPLAKMAVGGMQSTFAPMTGTFSELVSRRLGNLARRLPVPDPETLGQQTEEMVDVGGAPLIAKGMGALRAPLTRLLPTIPEKAAATKVAGEARLLATESAGAEAQLKAAERFNRMRGTAGERLARLESLAPEAQRGSAETYAKGMERVRTARSQAEERLATGVQGVEAQLVEQQAKVGLEAAKTGAPAGPKRMNFEKRYGALEQAADQIPIRPVNLNVKAHSLIREPGIPGTPTLPSERSSAAISRTLTEADPEEIGNQVRRMLTSGTDVKPLDYKAITRTVLGPATADDVTIGELLRARKRLREAERAAYRAEHKNLARQWGEMEDAITEDIKELAKTDKRAATIYRQSRNLDKDYFKKKATDWYAEGVDQAFDPKTGVWDRKRFTKWWEDHADSTNDNKHLRRLLGDRYEQTQGLIGDMQKATEMNIEKAAAEAVKNVRRTYGQEMREVGKAGAGQEAALAAREKEIGRVLKEAEGSKEKRITKIGGFETSVTKRIQLAQTKNTKAIEEETKAAVEKLTEGKFKVPGRLIGSLQVVRGLHQMATGTLTGNVPQIGMGAILIGTGVFTVTHAETLGKVLSTAVGHSITRRLIRAAPGSAEAVAASNAFVRLAQKLEGTAEQATTPAEPSAKESLMKKYGIQ